MRRMDSKYFDHGIELAQRSAKYQLEIIMANLNSLGNVRGGDKLVTAARGFNAIIQRKEKLTPNQLSFVESIYEKVFEAKGFESCKVHHDKKRKDLRF